MKNLYLLFFNEDTEEGFPGLKNRKIGDLQIFARYRVQELHDSFVLKDSKNVVVINNFDDLSRLKLLFDPEDIIILFRSSNILFVENVFSGISFLDSDDIIKCRVGMVPSDLYIMHAERFFELQANVIEVLSDGVKNHEIIDRYPSFSRFVFDLFQNILFHSFSKLIDIDGWSFLIRNLFEYYQTNLLPLTGAEISCFFNEICKKIETKNRETKIGANGFVKNSLLGPGSYIDGHIVNSVLFGDTRILRGTRIINSVILSGNEIKENVLIKNTIVLEGNGRIIGRESCIGGASNVNNGIYPDYIKNGLTVIGENVNIPDYSRIGSGCFIGNMGETTSPLELEDGKSLY